MDQEQSLVNCEEVSDLISYLDDDVKESFTLTDGERKRLRRYLKKSVLSPTFGIPQICRGDKCSFCEVCPLYKLKKYPVGKECPLELYLSNKWKDEYISALDVDWNNKIERSYVCELVEIDIIQARANTLISTKGIVTKNAIGISEQTGEPIYRDEPHVALGVKEKLANRRSRVLRELLATRESRAKFMQDMKGDPSVYAAKLRDKYDALVSSNSDVEIIDAVEVEEEDNAD